MTATYDTVQELWTDLNDATGYAYSVVEVTETGYNGGTIRLERYRLQADDEPQFDRSIWAADYTTETDRYLAVGEAQDLVRALCAKEER